MKNVSYARNRHQVWKLILITIAIIIFIIALFFYYNRSSSSPKPYQVYVTNLGESMMLVAKHSSYPFKLGKDWRGPTPNKYHDSIAYAIQDKAFVFSYGKLGKQVEFSPGKLLVIMTVNGRVDSLSFNPVLDWASTKETKDRLAHLNSELAHNGWKMIGTAKEAKKEINDGMKFSESAGAHVDWGEAAQIGYRRNDECLFIMLHPKRVHRDEPLYYLLDVGIRRAQKGLAC